MTSFENLPETESRFLQRLYDQTGDDVAAKVSMYDIGESLQLDRSAAKYTAEALIGLGLVEIWTLSGAIGITADGIDTARGFPGAGKSSTQKFVALGNNRVPEEPSLRAIQILLVDLKSRVSDFGLDFDGLGEVMADIKSIDAQLTSPKPKTSVLRACLESIQELLESIGKHDCLTQIKGLLGSERAS